MMHIIVCIVFRNLLLPSNFEEQFTLSDMRILRLLSISAGLILGGQLISIPASAQDGEALFKANCASCHKLSSKRLVGPGLEGINEKRSEEWLISWIKDPMKMVNDGDAEAVAIFEEYNKLPMTAFGFLSDDEIKAMLAIIPGKPAAAEGATAEAEEDEPVAPMEYTEEDAIAGQLLFTGESRFVNSGPSCVTCHHVSFPGVMSGGLLAKDLTDVHGRLLDAGVSSIISAPPFPAMADAYNGKSLTDEEVLQLTAFFKTVNNNSPEQADTSSMGFIQLLGGGFIGLIVWLVIIYAMWSYRKKESVKADIFKRQLKGNDSVNS